jgi:hypothetical protein
VLKPDNAGGRFLSPVYNSQNIASQRSNAAGTANISPRPKLLGRRCALSAHESASGGCSNVIANSAISAAFAVNCPRHEVKAKCKVRVSSRKLSTGKDANRHSSRSRLITSSIAWAMLATTLATPALTQDRSIETPESLVIQAEPIGISAGPVMIYPQASADIRYDSNIFNREDRVEKDMAAVFRGTARIVTDFNRHQGSLNLSTEVRRYFDNSAENSEQFAINPAIRFDLGNRLTLTTSALGARRIERRGTSGDQFLTDRPVEFDERTALVSLARTGGLLEIAGTARTTRFSYKDASINGVPIDLSARDVRQSSIGVRADFYRGGQLGVFASARLNEANYSRDIGPRDSNGGSALVGVNYRPTPLSKIEFGLGYIHQNFDNPVTRDLRGVDYWLEANWVPTPRLRLVASGGRSIERGPVPEVSSVVESRIDAEASYAFGTRTLLGLNAGFVKEDFRGVNRSNQRYLVEAQVRRQINRQLSAFAGVGYRKQTSGDIGGRNYDGMTARIGIRIAP